MSRLSITLLFWCLLVDIDFPPVRLFVYLSWTELRNLAEISKAGLLLSSRNLVNLPILFHNIYAAYCPTPPESAVRKREFVKGAKYCATVHFRLPIRCSTFLSCLHNLFGHHTRWVAIVRPNQDLRTTPDAYIYRSVSTAAYPSWSIYWHLWPRSTNIPMIQ